MRIRWVPAHRTLDRHRQSEWPHILGNSAADVLADRGAQIAQVPQADADYHLAIRRVAIAVQQRLVALVAAAPRRPHQPRFLRTAAAPFSVSVLATSHTVQPSARLWSCTLCHSHSGGVPLRVWLSTPCSKPIDTAAVFSGRPVAVRYQPVIAGSTIDRSHDLWFLDGLYFCRLCGHYAAWLTQRLAQPCRRVITQFGSRSVRSLCQARRPSWIPLAPRRLPSSPGLLVPPVPRPSIVNGA